MRKQNFCEEDSNPDFIIGFNLLNDWEMKPAQHMCMYNKHVFEACVFILSVAKKMQKIKTKYWITFLTNTTNVIIFFFFWLHQPELTDNCSFVCYAIKFFICLLDLRQGCVCILK